MMIIDKDTRLTDELERQLMMQAIEDQFRFKPFASLKSAIAKLAGVLRTSKTPVRSSVESAS